MARRGVLAALTAAALAWLVRGPAVAAPSPPLLLATLDEAGLLQVDPTAAAALDQLPAPLCAIAVAGPAREGKSTFANALQAHLHRLRPRRGSFPFGAAFGSAATAAAAAAPPPFPLSHGLASHGLASHGFAAERSGERSGERARPDAEPAAPGAVWIWAVPAAGVQGCGSVAVLDAQALGRGNSAGARRQLAFLSLLSSQLVLNVRRQPSTELLELLQHAAAAAAPLRPAPPPPAADAAQGVEAADAARAPTAAPAQAAQAASGAVALPPPPGSVADGTPPDAPLPTGGPELPALVVLLRDASLQLRLNGAALTEQQALAHWFGGLSRPAALQRAFRGHSLLPLGAPTELDLELLSRSQLGEISQPRSQPRSQPAALHSAFGAALGDAAATVVGGLAPLPQLSADGASLGAWASLVADWLNREAE